MWVVTRHQNGISAFVSQTSFLGETGSGVAKCRLFCQANLFRKLPDVLNNFFLVCLFQLPEDFQVLFDDAAGELIIGGIYLRLFIQQPAWVSVMNVSICPQTSFWDRNLGRAGQLLDNILLTVPDVFA